MRANLNKWWLLPLGVLATFALIASSIVIFGPSFVGRSPDDEVAQRADSRSAADCSGDSASDYACYQKRYQALVQDSGVDAAFTELKDEYENNSFVKGNCHQLTHVIGRAAAGIYGEDIATTYSHGDNFCWSGYYHGAMEDAVAKIGPEKILDEANTICADLNGHQRQSFYHYNCAHGLGHGFMEIQDHELFDSLRTCDTLTDDWERTTCYGGVFMENIIAQESGSYTSKYLKADHPLYPCTDVEYQYKNECYKVQTSYALHTTTGGNDWLKVFDLCSTVEDDFRGTCYQSLGRDISGLRISDVSIYKDICMLGPDDEARVNCTLGVAKDLIAYYNSDVQAKALCETFDEPNNAAFRNLCLETVEERYKQFEA